MASLLALPAHLAYDLTAFLDKKDILRLSLASKELRSVYIPTIYRTIRISHPDKHLLPFAHIVLTQPGIASSIRELRVPCLRDLTSDQKQSPWPQDADLDKTLREQLESIINLEDRNLCFQAIRDGSRPDLVLMLVLTRTTELQVLDIGAMGPRDNRLTRLIFQRAAVGLRRVKKVIFGRTPAMPFQWYKTDVAQIDFHYSYALFADLFLLPALSDLIAYAIPPLLCLDLEPHGLPSIGSADAGKLFDFIPEIRTNTSIEAMSVSEMFAADKAHLGHVLKQCPSLMHLSFLSSDEACMNPEDRNPRCWTLPKLQDALEQGIPSLQSLTLAEWLTHNQATWYDQPARLDLRTLTSLTWLRMSDEWILCGGDFDHDYPEGEESVSNRLVNMLPHSLETLVIDANLMTRCDCEDAYAAAFGGFFLRQAEVVPNLKQFTIWQALEEMIWSLFKPSFDAAAAAGVEVAVHDQFDRAVKWQMY